MFHIAACSSPSGVRNDTAPARKEPCSGHGGDQSTVVSWHYGPRRIPKKTFMYSLQQPVVGRMWLPHPLYPSHHDHQAMAMTGRLGEPPSLVPPPLDAPHGAAPRGTCAHHHQQQRPGPSGAP